MTRCAIYTRVSTEDQVREGYSLEVQQEYLLDFAKRNGWEVYAPKGQRVYHDDGISGYVLARPALQQLLFDAKQKKFDLVLVYKLDRFSRRLKDLLEIVDQLDAWGVGFKSATEPFETTSSAGRLMLQQLGSFAEFERNRIAERVFPGMVKSIQQGYWHGARYAPYGYGYNKEKRLLEVVPEEAKIVKLIYTMYLAGQSTAQIAGYLYKRGYKTRSGGTFHSKLVLDILNSPVYIGKLVWNKSRYDKRQKTSKGYKYVKNPPEAYIIADGKHEPIVALEDYEQVQARLAARRRRVSPRLVQSHYVLTGILICGRCGHHYRGSSFVTNAAKKLRKPWYRCSGPEMHAIRCGNPSVRAEVVEAEVVKIVERLMQHEAVLKRRVDKLVYASAEPDEELARKRSAIQQLLKTNLEKQGKLSRAYLESDLAREVYKAQSVPLREEEQDLRQQIQAINAELVQRERSQEYQALLYRLFSSFSKTRDTMTLEEKKILLQAIFKRVVVNDGRIVDYELHRPLLYLEDQRLTSQPAEPQQEKEKWASSCILLPTADQ